MSENHIFLRRCRLKQKEAGERLTGLISQGKSSHCTTLQSQSYSFVTCSITQLFSQAKVSKTSLRVFTQQAPSPACVKYPLVPCSAPLPIWWPSHPRRTQGSFHPPTRLIHVMSQEPSAPGPQASESGLCSCSRPHQDPPKVSFTVSTRCGKVNTNSIQCSDPRVASISDRG